MATVISPDAISGFNAVGRRTGTKDELAGLSFPTTCPPDVGPRTRVLAVCGIVDESNAADPENDGWFFSDFYLFRHLLSHAQGPTPNQIWMTSESPRDLVRKYKEYVHGDPRGDRRIVLDEEMLEAIEQSGTMRVVSRRDLLERFLSTLREQSRIARDNDEHLLILLFGHGDDDTFGLVVGSGSNDSKLEMERLKSHLQPNIPVTLFMTSCFSGGWLTQPITNTAQHINSTGMTAAGEDSKSVSWPLSASLRRACWGRFATAVLQSTLAIEESQEIFDGVNDIRNDPTYIAFAASVHETYRRLDSFSDERQIQFSAQDDRWGDHFIRRSGLPLSQFRARWESLRSIPQGDYDQGGDEVSRTGSMPFGTLRKRSKLEFAAREYLRAHPGEGYEASNVGLHGQLWAFLRRQKRFSDKDIDDLLAAVKYRADALSQANKLAAVMKINNPFFNAYTYNEHWQRSPEEDKIYKVAWRLVVTKRLVDKPSPYVPYYLPSRSWTKPNSFLAMCFAKAGLTPTEVEEKISLALSHKKEEAEDISRRYGSHAMGDAEVARHREQLLNKIRSFKAKMMGTSRG